MIACVRIVPNLLVQNVQAETQYVCKHAVSVERREALAQWVITSGAARKKCQHGGGTNV